MEFLNEWGRPEFFGALGLFVSGMRIVSYYWCLYKRTARPHTFSWFLWAVMVGIAATSQWQVGGGPSVWVLACVATFCASVAVIGLFIGEKKITRGDWVAFIGVLIVIPVWLMSKDPVLTLILLIFMDAASYYPTWRKMWHDPWSEPLSGFFLSGLRYFFALCALPVFGWAAFIYPFFLMMADWAGGVYAHLRRRAIEKERADAVIN